jgi:hypothetical protein
LAEVLMETAYALAMKVSKLPLKDPGMIRFNDMARLFDQNFRPDAVQIWDALRRDGGAALGAETALVIDLDGAFPALPGVAQELVDQAKFPRVSLVAPVEDHAKLASAWEGVHRGMNGILATIGEMKGTQIPTQQPMSSEKDGFTTWFFPMPFFNDDFLPSVTVGGDWIAASSSRNHALQLLGKAGTGEARSGWWCAIRFDVLRAFADETLILLEKHPNALPLDAAARAMIRKVASATEDLEKLTAHSRRENGVLRTSIHLQTR